MSPAPGSTALVDDAEVRRPHRVGDRALASSSSRSRRSSGPLASSSRRLAREQPLVVVFDDLHWAEPTFLDLVDHLVESARRARAARVHGAAGPSRPLRRARLGRTTASAFTSSLSADAAGLILENLLGGNGIPAALRARIVDGSRGQPALRRAAAVDAHRRRSAAPGERLGGRRRSHRPGRPANDSLAHGGAPRPPLRRGAGASSRPRPSAATSSPRRPSKSSSPDPLRARVGESLAALSRKQLLQPAEEDAHAGPRSASSTS